MAVQRSRRRIPEATVARLPVYLRILGEQVDIGVGNMSSEELAELAGVNAAKVRKDLSYLGSYGTRGVGYDVEFLVYQIRRELGLTHDWPVVIVGAGNLGQALAGYNGFGDRGFPVGGIVDIDDAKVGSVVGGVRVRHLDEIKQVVQARNISIGVIATPGAAAQDAADSLVAAGVTSILNFTPTVINVPHGISVGKVDLAVELQILAYHEQRRINAAQGSGVQSLSGLSIPGESRRGASA
jgi:redox-sensing transcriptional repressor